MALLVASHGTIVDAPPSGSEDPAARAHSELPGRAVIFFVTDPEVVPSRERGSVPRVW
jgi:hypothetical protein